jgi:hypothetical protein
MEGSKAPTVSALSTRPKSDQVGYTHGTVLFHCHVQGCLSAFRHLDIGESPTLKENLNYLTVILLKGKMKGCLLALGLLVPLVHINLPR